EGPVQGCFAAGIDCAFEIEAADGYIVAADGDWVSSGSVKGRVIVEADGGPLVHLYQRAANDNRRNKFHGCTIKGFDDAASGIVHLVLDYQSGARHGRFHQAAVLYREQDVKG